MVILKHLLIFALYAFSVEYAYNIILGNYHIGLWSIPTLHPANLISVILITPLWEEALYRYGPITIAKHFGEKLVFPVVVMSSLLFGWSHNLGVQGIIFQGVFGFVLSNAYIDGKGYQTSVTLHSLWNLSCILLFDQMYYY